MVTAKQHFQWGCEVVKSIYLPIHSSQRLVFVCLSHCALPGQKINIFRIFLYLSYKVPWKGFLTHLKHIAKTYGTLDIGKASKSDQSQGENVEIFVKPLQK